MDCPYSYLNILKLQKLPSVKKFIADIIEKDLCAYSFAAHCKNYQVLKMGGRKTEKE